MLSFGSYGVRRPGPGNVASNASTVAMTSAIIGVRQHAGVTQLVECLLPKQNVVGSSPITRSDKSP